MSACGSLQHIFENPSLPEIPTLLESLSWNQIKQPVIKSNINDTSNSSFTEIFGELQFKESPQLSPSPSSSFSEIINHTTNLTPPNDQQSVSLYDIITQTPSSFSSSASVSNTPTATDPNKGHKSSDSFSSLSSESLHLCTEGVGFESCDDAEDLMDKRLGTEGWQSHERENYNNKGCKKNATFEEICNGELVCRTRSRVNNWVEYPPPISCIGRKSGKPWVSFMPYRYNGRFVLKEIRVPTQEFLHAHREDGRLKLHFVHSDDEEFLEEEEEELELEDDDNNHEEEEEGFGDIESIGEGEGNRGKETHHESAADQVIEENRDN
ncbi:hypothetical protein RJT34_31002 [Clitoria ternatea]|uniref:FAF domain-containing protein n=1 Tax=Clitoria ternatea TaxID=43366 RepID=A0AAN9EUJ0_CLITE